jgi:phage FluMu gp28-like protein
VKLPAVMQLRPYQQAWIDDASRFKFAVKSARIGFSFATALEALLDCIEHPNTTWTILSASKAQSVEFVETASKLVEMMGATVQHFDEPFADFLGATDILVHRIQLPNGARVMALAANPRTARGYPGNAVLDEYGHHEDSYAIWAAIIRQTALGHKVRVLSTPNGEQGKFYDIARDLGLADGVAPPVLPVVKGPWSGHWVDVFRAVAEGCPINISEMRAGVGDDDTWNQEFLCVFLKSVGAWMGLDIIAACEDASCEAMVATQSGTDVEAALGWPPPGFNLRGPLYAGIDVGRDHDATMLWLDEKIGDVMWTRALIWLYGMSFPRQARLLNPIVKMTTRTAMDKTGMGVGLFDDLNELGNSGRLMGVSFSGSNDQGVRMKTDLAIRIKKQFEKAKCRIPYLPQVRTELQSIKREATGSGVTFDAPRIEVDSAVAGGVKKKKFSHADAFWGKALTEYAAESSPCEVGMTPPNENSAYQDSKGYQ